jgi:two-component system, NtrC family, response regulator HydG
MDERRTAVTKAPQLLIVDDEPDTCANLADIFTEFGYRVDIAHDGPSALQKLEHASYDLALLDLKMPGMNGLELYREIRRRSSDTVAIVVTAYASSETAKSVLEAGAWRIVSKPVDFTKLLGYVDEALNQPLVLVVDDDHDLCHSLWDLFHEQGYRVFLSHDLQTTQKQLRKRVYQVVLIDMKLQQGNGTDVLRMVKVDNPQARTLIITGLAQEMDRSIQEALACGADGVCYKPFDVDQLLKTVQHLVN